MEIGNEISHKIKTAIKSKLVEFGSYVDDELPDYIMVMVANKRSQIQMCNDLNLFLGENSEVFCEWLHELLQKLKDVTEGAFEVKVPVTTMTTNLDDAKPAKVNIEATETESLKISKIMQKPSPIRVPSGESDSQSHNEGTLKIMSNKLKGRTSDKTQIQSAVIVQKRPILQASKQANPNLLKKAMKAAQVSVEDDSGEYNPEASSELSPTCIIDPESKKKQREILLEEHKKLQRLKSQHELDTEQIVTEPMIELEVDEDDDLFNTEEEHVLPLTKDRRIVVEKDEGSDNEVSQKYEHSKKKKERKPDKRKLEEESELSLELEKEPQSGAEQEVATKSEESQQKSGKTKDKKRKPKFIVTLEGVGSEFEAKYEQERKKKRRKGSRTDKEPVENNMMVPGPQMIPIYPTLPHDVPHVPHVVPHVPHVVPHVPHVPVMAAATHLNPMVQTVQVIPAATIVTPQILDTAQSTPDFPVAEDDITDQDTLPLSETKCRFWPQCKNGDDCPYFHPGVSCKHFPHCRYGKDCTYIHPPCKFGPNCTSSSCSFSHPQSSTSTETPTLCRYHPYCTRKDCPFLHPTEKLCRYGSSCTRKGCPFNHSVPPPREQLKWVASKEHISDRQFAVNESSTTPLQVQ